MIRAHFITNYLMLCLLMIIACSIQTSLWFEMLGSFPEPLLWLCIMTYLALYRPLKNSIITIYLLTVVVAAFTATNIGILMFYMLIIYLIMWLLKSRVFWPGVKYFTIACTVCVIVFHISGMILSKLVLGKVVIIDPLTRIGQVLMTPLFTVPIYRILYWIDQKTIGEFTSQYLNTLDEAES